MRWRIGTMGFSYPAWAEEGVFYPKGVKAGQYLSYYAGCFDTVELDTTFYAAPDRARVEKWAGAVPPEFRFSLKTPRDVTHSDDVGATVPLMREFVTTVRHFGERLMGGGEGQDGGLVLLQFPASFTAARWKELETLVRCVPTDIPLAAEFRHVSWWKSPGAMKFLEDYGIAWTSADYVGSPRELRVTTGRAYLRLIGEHNRYPRMNREEADVTADLAWWHEQVLAVNVREAWVMFNNDYAGFSVATAERFKRLAGLTTTRPVLAPPGGKGQEASLFGE